MDNNMKNIIVLRDLPSNIIEEAIVILKANQKIKDVTIKDKKQEGKKEDEKKHNKDYIIKEAEMLVNSYISNIEKTKEINHSTQILKQKYKKLKILTIILAISTIVLWIF